MIKQFFKVLWNNKRRNVLVFIELFMISLVFFNLAVYLINLLEVYRIKNCYDTNDVVVISIRKKSDEDNKISEVAFNNLKKVLASNQFVEAVAVCNNAAPYNYNTWRSEYEHDSEKISMDPRYVDFEYDKVMKVKPLKGRWFNETDLGKAVLPVLISKEVDEKNFNGKAVGERLKYENKEYEIIGVTDRFKRSDIEVPDEFAFMLKDSVNAKRFWGTDYLIRTKAGHSEDMLAVAERQVYSTINPDNWVIDGINSLENMHSEQNAGSYQQNTMTVIIAVFIMINIFLGTIGILWYNTNLRYHEIGVRRALGATGFKIKNQLIAESLVLALAGVIIVVIIVAQSPILFGRGQLEPGVLFKSIIISTISVLILVIMSTWLPASIASKIKPAVALKSE